MARQELAAAVVVTSPHFEADCLLWRGRVLRGLFAHYCPDWDFLPVDESTHEWPCECFRRAHLVYEEPPKGWWLGREAVGFEPLTPSFFRNALAHYRIDWEGNYVRSLEPPRRRSTMGSWVRVLMIVGVVVGVAIWIGAGWL